MVDAPLAAKAFLARALQADEQAGLCKSEIAKAAWLDVARQYRFLAGFADRRGA